MRVQSIESKICLAFDLGGTKLEVGVVRTTGEILNVRRELLNLELGKAHVLEQMITWGREYLVQYPEITEIGISSCGPLDPVNGVLLDPTNLLTGGKGWGSVPLRAILEEALARQTYLDNDAACCVLAERYLGAGRVDACANLMVLTLGTGLGTGILCNDVLFRSGRFRHPEAGHMIIAYDNVIDPCACGVYGDGEAFLSGTHFAKRFNRQHGTFYSARDITALARAGDLNAQAAFQFYARVMAVTLHNYCVIFCPERIVFGGSFAEAFDLFAPMLRAQLSTLLVRRQDIVPQLCASQLQNHACLLGAALLGDKQGF